MTRPATLLLTLLAACAAHPADPDALELVQARAQDEPAAARVWRARLRGELEGQGPLELWLPLPARGEGQEVDSLVVEVGPPGTYEVLGEGQARELHVSGPPPRLSAGWRARVSRQAALAPATAAPASSAVSWSLVAGSEGQGARLVEGAGDRPGVRLGPAAARGADAGEPRSPRLTAELSGPE